MKTNKKCVVILAAGMGTRLSALSNGTPKALVDVAGNSLLDRALSFASTLSPEGTHIVVAGFQVELFRQHHVASLNHPYLLIENSSYRDGSVCSVQSALRAVTTDMYLINADHIFPPASRDHFEATGLTSVSVFCDQTRKLGPDDMKIKTHAATCTVQKMSKTLPVYDYGYIGVSYIPREKLDVYRDAVAASIKEKGRNASAESVVQLMADKGEKVQCIIADNIEWFEIDTPEDYQRAVLQLKGQ